MKKLITLIVVILICLTGCSTEKTVAPKPMDELIVEGKTTAAELEQILGKPSFYVTPEPPETGKYWAYINWKGRVGSPKKYKTTHKVLVRDGIAVKYSSATVLETEETNPVDLVKQGVAFGKKGEYDQAIALFNKAIDINPKFPGAYYGRGLTYYGKGQYDRAIADFNKAIKLKPAYVYAYYNRGRAYAKGKEQYDKAIADFNEAIEMNPRFARAYNDRGVTRYRIGEYDGACSDLQKACDLGICKGLSRIKKEGYCQERLVDTPHKPTDIPVSTVKLHSPKIPKVSTPDGAMASLGFKSEKSLEGYKLVLVLDFQVNQGGVSSVKHYLYQGTTPQVPKHGFGGQFSMSPGHSGQISFFMFTPQIQGPPSKSFGYQSYGQQSFFELQGQKNVSICLCMCQDGKCTKTLKISNSIKELVNF
jgi:hypothetical protein